MKGKWNLLIGLILGAILGWMLFYLRFPAIKIHHQFWAGLVFGVSIISLLQVIRTNWYKSSGKRSKWFWFLSLIAGIVALIWVLELRSVEEKITLEKEHYERLEDIARGENAERIQSLTPLIAQLIDQLDRDISADPERRVGDAMVKRIAELTRSLKPRIVEKGSVVFNNPLSPERAQLLHALIALEMSPESFDQIKKVAHFGHSDLIDADLSGVDLSGIDLHEAKLNGANLIGTNFTGASLQGCELQRAEMDSSVFQHADLKRSNMSWSNANGAVFIGANMDGADLSSAKFRMTNFQESSLQWTTVANAIFEDSDFSNANLKGANGRRANFRGVNLTHSNISRTDFKEADLSEAKLDYAGVKEETWMRNSLEWNAEGLDELGARFNLVKDSTGVVKFRLEPNQ